MLLHNLDRLDQEIFLLGLLKLLKAKQCWDPSRQKQLTCLQASNEVSKLQTRILQYLLVQKYFRFNDVAKIDINTVDVLGVWRERGAGEGEGYTKPSRFRACYD